MAIPFTTPAASERRAASGWTLAWQTGAPRLPGSRPRLARELLTLGLLFLALTGLVLVWRHEHPDPFRRIGSYEPPGLLATYAGSLVVRATLVSERGDGPTDGPMIVRRLADWEIRAELLEAAPSRVVLRLHDVRWPGELLHWALRPGRWRVHLRSIDQTLPVAVLEATPDGRSSDLRRPLARYSTRSCRELRPLRERITRLLGRTTGCECDGDCVAVLVDDPPLLTERDLARAFLWDPAWKMGSIDESRDESRNQSRRVIRHWHSPRLRFFLKLEYETRATFLQGYASPQPWVGICDGELINFATHVRGRFINTVLPTTSFARAWSEIVALNHGPLEGGWHPLTLVDEATQQPLGRDLSFDPDHPESLDDGYDD